MTKSALVKIGVAPEQAQGMQWMRRIRQLLDQGEAAKARIDAATQQKIRDFVTTSTVADEAVDEVSEAPDTTISNAATTSA